MQTPEQHKQRHIELHKALDELVYDWGITTGNIPSENSIMSLMEWSFKQTQNPVDKLMGYHSDMQGIN